MIETNINTLSFDVKRVFHGLAGLWVFANLILVLSFCQGPPTTVEIPDEHRFRQIILTEDTMNPMAMAIADDGRVFFAEDFGTIKIYDQVTSSLTVAGELSAYNCGDFGLIGMTLDPDFLRNGWLYVNRTLSNDLNLPCLRESEDTIGYQLISRFTVVEDTIDMLSEKKIFSFPVQNLRHIGGSIAFDAEGNLFISVGENTHPGFTNPYAPVDERSGHSRFDAQRTSSNTLDYRGKILRIHPEDDGTYTIPEGNLFPKEDTLSYPEIYVMGCRNPFRISVDQKAGVLYWGEVGPDAYVDIERGPKGYDEINRTATAGFFGWPYFAGDNQAYAQYDYEKEKAGLQFVVNEPENNSPNNTGRTILPASKSAFIWYPYAPSEQFPELGDGGRTAMSGPVYYYNPESDSDIKFPSYFDDALFIYDWMRGWINIVRINELGEITKIENFMPSSRFIGPIDMQFGPDGSLYLLEFGSTWGDNPDARLIKIEYIKGNRPPHVVISANQTAGTCPLEVRFSSEGTVDFDKGDKLKYEWQFNSEDVQSSEENPVFVFEQPGIYTARLTVTDSYGEITSSDLQITAGNGVPELLIEMPNRGSFYWKQDEIPYLIHLEDAEDGSLADGSIKPANVQVSLEWMKGTHTMEASDTGEKELKGPGQKLIGESDCKSCHQAEKRMIGPSYLEIANKYQNDGDASTYLAKKIISGGSGVWGKINMSAHPIFSEEDAGKMADYILSLASVNQNVKKMDISGVISIPEDIELERDGTYVLTATYTDRGSSGIDPITVTTVRILHPPQLEAENFSSQKDLLSEAGAKTVLMGFSSTYISFRNIDLTNVDSVTFRYRYKGPECSITIKPDSPAGESLGIAQFRGDPQTNGFRELSIPIKAPNGPKELFFLHDKAPDIHEEITLDWIRFHKKNHPES